MFGFEQVISYQVTAFSLFLIVIGFASQRLAKKSDLFSHRFLLIATLVYLTMVVLEMLSTIGPYLYNVVFGSAYEKYAANAQLTGQYIEYFWIPTIFKIAIGLLFLFPVIRRSKVFIIGSGLLGILYYSWVNFFPLQIWYHRDFVKPDLSTMIMDIGKKMLVELTVGIAVLVTLSYFIYTITNNTRRRQKE